MYILYHINMQKERGFAQKIGVFVQMFKKLLTSFKYSHQNM